MYNEVDLIIPLNSLNSTKLQKELLFNDKSIKVKSTLDFKDKGFIKIQNEMIFYNTKTKNSFDNIKRSAFNSIKKLKYDKNTNIIQKDINIWPSVIQKLEKLAFVIEVKIVSITNSKGRLIVNFMGNKKTFFQAAFEKNLKFKDLNSKQFILVN